jgi:hypothetical protein
MRCDDVFDDVCSFMCLGEIMSRLQKLTSYSYLTRLLFSTEYYHMMVELYMDVLLFIFEQ